MDALSAMVRFFQQGGIFMYPILIVFALGLAIAVERWIYLTMSGASNRALWNKELINLGMQYLKKSIADTSLSAYHIEASIGAEHCLAKSFETTDWQRIYDQYKLLEKLKPNPIITLNLAIIQSKLGGIKSSLDLLDELAKNKVLSNYHLLPATRGIFNMKLGNYKKAIRFLGQAQRLKPSLAESEFLDNKISECKRLLPTI